MRPLPFLCIATAAALGLSACASNDYGYGDRYGYAADRYGYPAGTCEGDRANNRVAGTVAGAALGALAGSAIAGNSSNTEGTVAGGVAGAVIGNQVAKGQPCPSDYYRR